MKLRVLLPLLFTLISSANSSLFAQAPASGGVCTMADATAALDDADRLHSWDELYRSYKKFAKCDDGAITEGYTDSIEKLLAAQWNLFPHFATLARSDNQFRIFVLKHLNSVISLQGGDTIMQNAEHNCPTGEEQLCRVIDDQLFAAGDPRGGVDNLPGPFWSPDGNWEAELRTNQVGGATDLFLIIGRTTSIMIHEDVTGVAWLSNSVLVFSASPIYGKPGIFVLNCMTRRTRRIVRPRTVNRAYPDGADYFELHRASGNEPATISFYYAPDVDSMDAAAIRSPAHLFEVRSDGTGFRKASSAPTAR
jgi:hypothetical protein